MIQVHCFVCKKSFYRQPSQVRYFKRQVCSVKCRNKLPALNKGKINGNWKGGRIILNGYIAILCPDHPFKHGYVFEHRLVMEKKLGRYLTKDEVVHHINGIKTDNREKNLVVLTKSRHHSIESMGQTYYKRRKRDISGKFI